MSMKIAGVLAQVAAAKPKRPAEKKDPRGFGADINEETAHQMCLTEAGRMLRRIESGNARRANRKNELDGFEYAGREVVLDSATKEIKYWIYLFKDKDEKIRSVIVSKKDGRFVIRKGKGAGAEIIKRARGTLSKVQSEKVVCKAPEIKTPLHDLDPKNPFGHSDLDGSDFSGLEDMNPLE